METIQHQGETIAVREVARPPGWSCRLLVSDAGVAYLEYLVSVGPYKIDLAVVQPLSREEHAAFEAGRLDLGAMAGDLARRAEATGAFERRD